MAGEKILVVDDDLDIREILSLYLENEGYAVTTANDGITALAYAAATKPDLIFLDMIMPGLDGIEVCQELRKITTAPILFLSNKSTAKDKSIGLIAGGDDYISKPFDFVELLARVRAHLRRNRILKIGEIEEKNSVLKFHDLTIDLDRYSVTAYGKIVDLSPKEFQLLVMLAKSPGTVFTNEELFNSIWGNDRIVDTNTVLVHISNLRKKVEKESKNPLFIQTIKGVGYMFTDSFQ